MINNRLSLLLCGWLSGPDGHIPKSLPLESGPTNPAGNEDSPERRVAFRISFWNFASYAKLLAIVSTRGGGPKGFHEARISGNSGGKLGLLCSGHIGAEVLI